MSTAVRKLRTARSLTQGELAELSGIERTKISRIENDGRRVSGTEALYLAEALGVTPEEILGQSRSVKARYRRTGTSLSKAGERLVRWFEQYVDDALFLERSARRYCVEN